MKTNLEATQTYIKIEGHNASLNEIEVHGKTEISNNLWIPLNSPIYSHSKEPWCTSFVIAPAGPPFILPQKWVDHSTGEKGL